MICRFKIKKYFTGLLCFISANFLFTIQFACGPYSFSSSGASHIKTVRIPIFQDQTSEFGIKEKLTEQVIQEFTRDNTLKVTDNRRNADSLIQGMIVRVDDRAGAFSSDETVQDIKVFITVSVKYEDLKKRKLIWEETITQWGTFNPDEGTQSRDPGVDEAAAKIADEIQSRDAAIDEAVAKIANEILNKSVSGW